MLHSATLGGVADGLGSPLQVPSGCAIWADDPNADGRISAERARTIGGNGDPIWEPWVVEVVVNGQSDVALEFGDCAYLIGVGHEFAVPAGCIERELGLVGDRTRKI